LQVKEKLYQPNFVLSNYISIDHKEFVLFCIANNRNAGFLLILFIRKGIFMANIPILSG